MKEIIEFDKTISVTELQKISLKKLRQQRGPLVVLDRKSKKRGFVILDLETYQGLTQSLPAVTTPATKKGSKTDFRSRGLLWDRPAMTNREFSARLKDPHHQEYAWAVKRFFEYAPSKLVTEVLSLEDIQTALS
ncbi:MAG: hypothetical protein HY465_04180, partial [Deltaproteobacteria bacterium]|nr:hypothetical protein [Deltaproteobacteria bacterium]